MANRNFGGGMNMQQLALQENAAEDTQGSGRT